MKKVIAILVLGLLWCNVGNALEFAYSKHPDGEKLYHGVGEYKFSAEKSALTKCRVAYWNNNKDKCKIISKEDAKKIQAGFSQKQIAEDKCKELGFTKGTEDFGDCVAIMLSKQ